MNKEEIKIIKSVIDKIDTDIKECNCGYKSEIEDSFCEMYGCSTLDELIKPLRELLKNSE